MKLHALALVATALIAGCDDDGDPVDPNRAAYLGCDDAAPLHGDPDLTSPQRFIVMYRANTPVVATTNRLEAEYDFEADLLFERAFPGFSATMDRSAVFGVRCAEEVELVSLDGSEGVLF